MRNLVWEQLTVGLAFAAGGAVVLLLVGTNILDWYWLVLLFAAGAGLTAWRTLRRMPSLYSVAQQVDERLKLHDSLSTALHFSATAAAGADPAIVQAQRAEAEVLAARVEAAAAWPVVFPKQSYVAGGLVAVVLALGILRYGKQGSLDLRAPMIGSVADFFWSNQPLQAQNKKAPPRTPGEEPLGINIDQQDSKNPDEPSLDDLLSTVETPDVNAEGVTSYSEKTDRTTVQAKSEEGNQSEAPEDGETGAESRESESAGNEGGNQAGSKEGQKGASPQNLPNENSSLLDKMRDAMSNLLSKLKIPPQTTQSAKNGQSSEGKQPSRDSDGGQKGEKGSGQPQQGKGNPSDEADSGDDGQGEQQQAQAGQGKSGDKAADSSSNDSNSGVGKQDGNKDLRDAEQLAAMGKISEIFGKRAQNMTGEIMVEVNSGKQQQLRTAYTSRGATHREAGGEIHRDEVPLVYQDYVQQYFEKVRRPEAAAPKPETR